MTDPSSAVAAFAAAIFEPDDIVEVRLLPSGAQRWMSAADLSSEVTIAWLTERNAAGDNVYFGANPRKVTGGSKAQDVALARCLFVDLDGGVTANDALARASDAKLPPPTVVVHSGGGVHLYWRLDEPLHDLAEFTRSQKAVIALLKSDACVHDAPRIMRLPGFVNHKYKPPALAALVDADASRKYAASQFAVVGGRSDGDDGLDAPHRTGAMTLLGATVKIQTGRAALSRRTLDLLAHGAAKGERNTRTFSAACDFAGCGIPQAEAERDLLAAATRHGVFEPGDFDEGQLRNAVSSAYSRPRNPSRAPDGGDVFVIDTLPRDDAAASTPPDGGESAELPPAQRLTIERKPGSAKGRAHLVVRTADEVVFTDEIKIASATSRRRFIKDVAGKCTGADVEQLEARLVQLAAAPDPVADEPDGDAPSREALLAELDDRVETRLAGMLDDVVREAEEMLSDPKLIDRLNADLEAIGIVGEQELAMTVYVVGTSRLLDKPLAAITQGLTSSGKSFVQELVARLFPPEALLMATDITPNAMFYLEPGALLHRFVVAGERPRNEDDERAQATRALREMLSAGELRKVVPVKTGDGPMVAQVLWRPGPIAFIESTTKAQIFDEDANRCLLLGTDESEEQTTRIVMAQALRATGATTDIERIIGRHHALQRMLRRCRVVIPFAQSIARAIPKDRQEARRAMPQILSMVSAVALLHQRQRATGPIEHGTVIRATLADYVVARRLLNDPLGRSLGGALPGAVARFAERTRDHYGEAEFTSSDVCRTDGTIRAKGKVNEYLRLLADHGVAECLAPARGNQAATWRMRGEVPAAGAHWLPTRDQLRGGDA